MNLNLINVSSSKVSIRIPQIYIISILEPIPIVYIGQTCQKNGVLGRFGQHMSDSTLKKILNSMGIEDFNAVSVIAVDLGDYSMYGNVYSRKREALEYLVQREMKVMGCKTRIPFEVISNVFYNAEVKNKVIERLAREIAETIIGQMPFY